MEIRINGTNIAHSQKFTFKNQVKNQITYKCFRYVHSSCEELPEWFTGWWKLWLVRWGTEMNREERLRRQREQDRARHPVTCSPLTCLNSIHYTPSNFHVMQQLLPSGLPHDASSICLVIIIKIIFQETLVTGHVHWDRIHYTCCSGPGHLHQSNWG